MAAADGGGGVWHLPAASVVGKGYGVGRAYAWRFVKSLGGGTYARVWLVEELDPTQENAPTGNQIVMRLSTTSPEWEAVVGTHVLLETMMSVRRSPVSDHFVRVCGFFETNVPPPPHVFCEAAGPGEHALDMRRMDRPFGCLLMEYARYGTLRAALHQHRVASRRGSSEADRRAYLITPAEAQAITFAAIWALVAMRKLQLRHGDFHAGNVLFSDVLYTGRESAGAVYRCDDVHRRVAIVHEGVERRLVFGDFDLTRSFTLSAAESVWKLPHGLPQPPVDEGPATFVLAGPVNVRPIEAIIAPRVSWKALPLQYRPSASTDVWSLGVLIAELYSGRAIGLSSHDDASTRRTFEIARSTWYDLFARFGISRTSVTRDFPPFELIQHERTATGEPVKAHSPQFWTNIRTRQQELRKLQKDERQNPLSGDNFQGYCTTEEGRRLLQGYVYTERNPANNAHFDPEAHAGILAATAFQSLCVLCYYVDAIGLPPIPKRDAGVDAATWLQRVSPLWRLALREDGHTYVEPLGTTTPVGMYPMFMDMMDVWRYHGYVYEHKVDADVRETVMLFGVNPNQPPPAWPSMWLLPPAMQDIVRIEGWETHVRECRGWLSNVDAGAVFSRERLWPSVPTEEPAPKRGRGPPLTRALKRTPEEEALHQHAGNVCWLLARTLRWNWWLPASKHQLSRISPNAVLASQRFFSNLIEEQQEQEPDYTLKTEAPSSIIANPMLREVTMSSQGDPTNGSGGADAERRQVYAYQRDVRLLGRATRALYGGGAWYDYALRPRADAVPLPPLRDPCPRRAAGQWHEAMQLAVSAAAATKAPNVTPAEDYVPAALGVHCTTSAVDVHYTSGQRAATPTSAPEDDGQTYESLLVTAMSAPLLRD